MSKKFGRRKQPHTIIIAHGDKINHFEIRPWVAALTVAVILAGSVGYLGATAYLIFRDDIINASLMRQARMQHAYEDRISALRSQVDRITSHRLLDQQFVETKIAELSSRQELLEKRAQSISPLLDRAVGLRGSQAGAGGSLPVPKLRPGTGDREMSVDNEIRYKSAGTTSGTNNPLFDLHTRLAEIDKRQVAEIASLTRAAHETRLSIIEKAKASGLHLDAKHTSATGGPFMPTDAVASSNFNAHVTELGSALEILDETRGAVQAFPIAHPAPGRAITSRYGVRRDPIIGKNAFHSGIDFRTPIGTPIYATAPGTVIKAGRQGGYGLLVEIRHKNGFSTRYAHLSRILVRKGDSVAAGKHIGAAGSTGRSTGPHLHYEVRRGDKATNPMTYLKAGSRLEEYLKN